MSKKAAYISKWMISNLFPSYVSSICHKLTSRISIRAMPPQNKDCPTRLIEGFGAEMTLPANRFRGARRGRSSGLTAAAIRWWRCTPGVSYRLCTYHFSFKKELWKEHLTQYQNFINPSKVDGCNRQMYHLRGHKGRPRYITRSASASREKNYKYCRVSTYSSSRECIYLNRSKSSARHCGLDRPEPLRCCRNWVTLAHIPCEMRFIKHMNRFFDWERNQTTLAGKRWVYCILQNLHLVSKTNSCVTSAEYNMLMQNITVYSKGCARLAIFANVHKETLCNCAY